MEGTMSDVRKESGTTNGHGKEEGQT